MWYPDFATISEIGQFLMTMILLSEETLELPFELETPLERRLAADLEWQAGIAWGKPRPGHPEGKVMFHIRDVLNNVDHFFGSSDDRSSLRLIALIHDTFKYKTAHWQPGTPKRSHSLWARVFAEKYIADPGILQVIEFHDEAYKVFLLMTRQAYQEAANGRAKDLIIQLGESLDLFLKFYRCDNQTGDKSADHYEWFKGLVEEQVDFGSKT
jgi:hypothetical protein